MKILFIDCCISQRGENSRTVALCNAFLAELKKKNTDITIEHLDLRNTELLSFNAEMLDTRDALFAAKKFDAQIYDLANRFRAAEGIVIGAPFWDLSFPAQLRIYIEHISANGVTYYYDEKGPHGNCKAKWLVYLSSGGDFERKGNISKEYWKQLCAMFGIEKYRSVFAGGLDAAPDKAEEYLAAAIKEARTLAADI